MYVDYAYYAEKYGGDKITEKQFTVYERRAEVYIRKLTYVRGDVFAVVDDAVKDAVCAVSEVYGVYDQKYAASGVVKSENNDGYSVTYVTEQKDGQTVEELIQKKAFAAASMYLIPTGWLSRKVGCFCDYEYRHNPL